jgi:hypothetical protein
VEHLKKLGGKAFRKISSRTQRKESTWEFSCSKT